MTQAKNENNERKLRELIGYAPTFGTASSFVIEALFEGWMVTFGKHSVRGHSKFVQCLSGWIKAKKSGYEVKVNVCQLQPSTVSVTKGKKIYLEMPLSDFRIINLNFGQFGINYAGRTLPRKNYKLDVTETTR